MTFTDVALIMQAKKVYKFSHYVALLRKVDWEYTGLLLMDRTIVEENEQLALATAIELLGPNRLLEGPVMYCPRSFSC